MIPSIKERNQMESDMINLEKQSKMKNQILRMKIKARTKRN